MQKKHFAFRFLCDRISIRNIFYAVTTRSIDMKDNLIPLSTLKKVLEESELQIEKAKQLFEPWSEIQLSLNKTISRLPSSHFHKHNYFSILSQDKQNKLEEYHQVIDSLPRHVATLVLSYTGIRPSEVMALCNDAAQARNGRFYLKILHSKTISNTQDLEIITNKNIYASVTLLTKFNNIYRDRAKLLLTYHADFLSNKQQSNMKLLLSNKQLFNVRPSKNFCKFISGTKLQSGDLFNFSPTQFRRTVALLAVANLFSLKYPYKHLESNMAQFYSHKKEDNLTTMD